MNEISITVFTPTYNRGYILNHAYESLKKQSYKKFKWVIVDDGSTDNTKSLIEKWKKENKVKIEYIYQENQGRFMAFNTGKEHFEGELLITLDSDDYLLKEALNKVNNYWNNIPDKENISGIIAYFEGADKKVIGSKFPERIKIEKSYVLYDKYKMSGDKFMIFKISLLKNYSYKVYLGERFCGDATLFNKINDMYPMYIVREKFCHREYQKDSITNNLLKYHMSSPNGMRDHYLDCIYHEKYDKEKILKHTLGFVTYSFLTNKSIKNILSLTNRKLLTISLLLPAYIYMKYLIKKFNNK